MNKKQSNLANIVNMAVKESPMRFAFKEWEKENGEDINWHIGGGDQYKLLKKAFMDGARWSMQKEVIEHVITPLFLQPDDIYFDAFYDEWRVCSEGSDWEAENIDEIWREDETKLNFRKDTPLDDGTLLGEREDIKFYKRIWKRT